MFVSFPGFILLQSIVMLERKKENVHRITYTVVNQ
jgi:hypothetical protein